MTSFYSLFILYRSGIKYFGQFSTYECLLEFISLEFQKFDSLPHDGIVSITIDFHEKDGFYV